MSSLNGMPIANKVVYLLDGNSQPTKMLLSLTTNQNGLATFSLKTANLPKAALNLVVGFALNINLGSPGSVLEGPCPAESTSYPTNLNLLKVLLGIIETSKHV